MFTFLEQKQTFSCISRLFLVYLHYYLENNNSMLEQKIFDKNGNPLSIITQLGAFLKKKSYELDTPLEELSVTITKIKGEDIYKLNLNTYENVIDSWEI